MKSFVNLTPNQKLPLAAVNEAGKPSRSRPASERRAPEPRAAPRAAAHDRQGVPGARSAPRLRERKRCGAAEEQPGSAHPVSPG